MASEKALLVIATELGQDSERVDIRETAEVHLIRAKLTPMALRDGLLGDLGLGRLDLGGLGRGLSGALRDRLSLGLIRPVELLRSGRHRRIGDEKVSQVVARM